MRFYQNVHVQAIFNAGSAMQYVSAYNKLSSNGANWVCAVCVCVCALLVFSIVSRRTQTFVGVISTLFKDCYGIYHLH